MIGRRFFCLATAGRVEIYGAAVEVYLTLHAQIEDRLVSCCRIERNHHIAEIILMRDSVDPSTELFKCWDIVARSRHLASDVIGDFGLIAEDRGR